MAGIAAKLARDRETAEGLGSHERAVKYLNQDYEALRDECLEAGALFQDPSFPAIPSSLGFKELGPYSSKTQGIVWKRPTVGSAGGMRGRAGPAPRGGGARASRSGRGRRGLAQRKPARSHRGGAARRRAFARVPGAVQPVTPCKRAGTRPMAASAEGACPLFHPRRFAGHCPHIPLLGPPGEPPLRSSQKLGQLKGTWGQLLRDCIEAVMGVGRRVGVSL